jgi:hypothetical protein
MTLRARENPTALDFYSRIDDMSLSFLLKGAA